MKTRTKHFSKFFSLLLAMLLVVGMLPTTVFAANTLTSVELPNSVFDVPEDNQTVQDYLSYLANVTYETDKYTISFMTTIDTGDLNVWDGGFGGTLTNKAAQPGNRMKNADTFKAGNVYIFEVNVQAKGENDITKATTLAYNGTEFESTSEYKGGRNYRFAVTCSGNRDVITGSASIQGTPKIGQTLSVTGTFNATDLKYEWIMRYPLGYVRYRSASSKNTLTIPESWESSSSEGGTIYCRITSDSLAGEFIVGPVGPVQLAEDDDFIINTISIPEQAPLLDGQTAKEYVAQFSGHFYETEQYTVDFSYTYDGYPRIYKGGTLNAPGEQETGTFKDGQTYFVQVKVTPKGKYTITNTATFTYNGKSGGRYGTDNGSPSFRFAMTADHTRLKVTAPNFDEVETGYSPVAAKTIQIKALGESFIIKNVSSYSDDFVVSNPGGTQMAYSYEGGENTNFTIKPKDGLESGEYTTHIVVEDNLGRIYNSDFITFVVKAKTISVVNVNVTEPKDGAKVTDPIISTANVNLDYGLWYELDADGNPSENNLTTQNEFEAGKTYRLIVSVSADSDQFDDTTTVNFNENEAMSYLDKGTSSIRCSYDFTCPEDNNTITHVNVSVAAPVAGEAPADATTSTSNAKVAETTWRDVNSSGTVNTFKAGRTYRCRVSVEPEAGYKFKSTTVSYNGKAPTAYLERRDGEGSKAWVTSYYEFVVPAAEYDITVNEGKAYIGAGTEITKAKENDEITITANAAAEGKEFAGWTVVSGNVTLTDSSKETTTFTMPGEAVEITATYKDKPVTPPHEHDFSGSWQRDDAGHWHKCPDDDATDTKAVHEYDDDADTTCNVCGYERSVTTPHTHDFSGSWQRDAEGHWHKCPDDDATDTKVAHEYDDDTDTSCNVCGYERTVTPPAPIAYTITKGNGQTVTKGNTANFVSDAPFDKFIKVKVDGADVAASNYTAVSGSTDVTFTTDYINSLSEGNHTIAIVSNDGQATGSFTVKAASTSDTEPTPTEYTITVNNGKASVGAGTEVTKAQKDTVVSITANAAAEGKEFAGWTVVSGNVTLVDASKETTTFTMPGEAVEITATYKDKETTPTDPTKPGDDTKPAEPTKPSDDTKPAEPTKPRDNKPADTTKTTENKTNSPKTGDNSNMILWLLLLSLSGAGLATSAVVRDKKRSAK